MNWHHKREHRPTRPAVDLDPIVYDIYGVPVGVRAPGARSPESETRASRHLARIPDGKPHRGHGVSHLEQRAVLRPPGQCQRTRCRARGGEREGGAHHQKIP
jgi:hypothetical protein